MLLSCGQRGGKHGAVCDCKHPQSPTQPIYRSSRRSNGSPTLHAWAVHTPRVAHSKWINERMKPPEMIQRQLPRCLLASLATCRRSTRFCSIPSELRYMQVAVLLTRHCRFEARRHTKRATVPLTHPASLHPAKLEPTHRSRPPPARSLAASAASPSCTLQTAMVPPSQRHCSAFHEPAASASGPACAADVSHSPLTSGGAHSLPVVGPAQQACMFDAGTPQAACTCYEKKGSFSA